MAKARDLTGKVYGKLQVIEQHGTVVYGGRRCTVWRCRCECGNELNLPYDKLPTTPKSWETMMRSGRRLYDCCETCREKMCPVCGDRFSHSHTSHVCPKSTCQETLRRERDDFWKAVHKYRRQTDAEYREADNEKSRAWHSKNADRVAVKRQALYWSLPDEEREQRRARNRRYYREMRRDPERYANWLAWNRNWRGQQHLKQMLADAAALQSIFEQESNDE